jgi:hypothetical protein
LKLQKTYYPACVIAILIVLVFGLCNICQLYLLKDSYPVSKLWVGSDYSCIYLGTQHLLRSGTPYIKDYSLPFVGEELAKEIYIVPNEEISWYDYTPLAAYLNYPLFFFDIHTASSIMFFLLISAVLCAYAIITSSFQDIAKKDRKIIFLYGLVIILLSYPFYFLIVRGHFIGFVVLLLALGIYFLKTNKPASGICFGLSTGLLMFPALMVFPLLLFRRYKVLIYAALTLCVLFLCCPNLWFIFLQKKLMLQLVTEDQLLENCSLANTFNYIHIFFNSIMNHAGVQFHITHYNEGATAVYFLTLGVMALADYAVRKKRGPLDPHIELTLVLMYLPWMPAFRKITYQYSLVLLILLIPAMCSLVQALKRPMPQFIFWLLAGGIALSQIQAHFLQLILAPPYALFHFFPGFGLFLVMIGCLSFKVWFWKRYE